MTAHITSIDRRKLSQEAFRVLRSRILSRRLLPGAKLIVRILADELKLSPTPIKEALAALEREGLVAAIPNRGYFVPRISQHDVSEIYSLREVIEGLAARLAAGGGSKGLLVGLEKVLAKQRAAVRAGDVEQYGDLDLTFHRLIWEAGANGRLLQTAEAFMGQVRLLISTSAKLPGRIRASLREHREIATAIMSRRPAAAEAAMRRHVRRAGVAVKAHVESNSKSSALSYRFSSGTSRERNSLA